jgi:hypothetical protein
MARRGLVLAEIWRGARSTVLTGAVLLLMTISLLAVAQGAHAESYEEAVEGTSGIAHFWPMGESSGSSFADVVGGENAEVSSSGVALGEPGGLVEDSSTSVAFDGISGAAQAKIDLSGTHRLTVEFWMKWHAYGADDHLALEFTPNFTEHPGGFVVDPDSMSGSDFDVTIGNGSSYNNVMFARPSAEQWHYYTFVIDTEEPAESEITPYIDGHAVSYTKSESNTDVGSFADSTLFWMSRDASTLFGAGSIQDLALYETTLSSTTILEHYERGENTYKVVNTTAPSIEGTAQDGQTLTANHGVWSGFEPISYAYQWQNCDSSGASCTNISGATSSTYVPGDGDVGSTLRVVVTGSNAGSSAEATSEATLVVSGLPPSNTTAPTISGTAEEGSTLSAEVGSWTGLAPITFGYQWRRCNGSGESCSDISGATSSAYNAGFEDVGHKLRVLLTATNAAGSGEALSSTGAFVAPAPFTELGYASEFGELGSGDGQFKEPYDVAIGAGGDIFVLDRGNDRVEKFNEASEYLGQFGEEGSGDGQLRWPSALAVDSKGDVWVADSGNERIEEFNESGEFLRTAGEGMIGYAEGIAIDRSGRVWVSATSGGYLAVFGEDGEFFKEVSSKGSEPGQLGEPEGLTVDAKGDVWVSDYHNARIEKFSESGEYLGEFGSEGGGAGELSGAYSIAADAGHVFVSEWGNRRVQEFDEEGDFIAQLDVPGSEAGELGFPVGLAIDPAHDLLITDVNNNRIELWSPEAEGAPANLSPPSISGTPGVGSTLAVSAGVWRGSPRRSYSYQWQRCNEHGEECADIVSATSSTYPTVGTDLVDTLRVIVTSTNTDGSASSTTAASEPITVPPTNLSLPTISGTAEEGQELTADLGTWEGASGYGVEWQRCDEHGEECSEVEWGESYIVTAADIGHTLRVVVYGWNSAGEVSATSAPIAVVTGPTLPINLSVPTITGVAQDGQTLRASVGEWEGTPPLTYAYQWQSCDPDSLECHDIEGATSSGYTLGTADLETRLRVVVTASNVAGSAQAISVASTEIEPGAPSEQEAPSVIGDPVKGETLHAEAGQWGGTENEVGYQWERCNTTGGECADIAGATEPDYLLTEGDIGITLRVRVGVSNALGSVTAISPETDAIGATSTLMNTWAPSISGTPQSGQSLSANAGSWLGIASIGYEYQWQKCDVYGATCEDITGAIIDSYTPSAENVGSAIRVRVSATEEGGTVAETSTATQPVAATTAPVIEAPPGISGTGLVGDELVATTGVWSGEEPLSYSYQWERCNEYGESCSTISGATTSTYTLTESDATRAVRVLVTATDAGAASTKAASFPLAVSAATLANIAAPSISGTYEAQRALSANRGIWTGAGSFSYSYQWKYCNEYGESCSTISGATEPSYTPGEADVGHTLEVVVTATGTAGTESVTSSTTPAIVSETIAPEDILAPSIEGNLTSGDILTAQTGTWVSSETISYSYQWQTCDEEGEECADISGATSSTYELIEGDIGSTIRVVVTASNLLGTASATSYQSETVGAVEPPKVSEDPAINGTAREGAVLFADNGAWSGSQPLGYYYQWERCNLSGESCTDIESANKPSYTATSGDVGSALRIKVTVTNSAGSMSAVSVPALVASGTEGNITHALEAAEATDPSILAPSTTATLEEQTVKPAIGNSEEVIASSNGLTSSTISKETPGEFAVNTSVGELSFTPLDSSANATTTPTIVNGTAAVFAETSHATDTFVRPTPLGATTLLQMRSSQAPTSFSWEVGIGSDQELMELPGGSIAVVEPESGPDLESELPSETLESSESEPTEKPAGEGASEGAAGKEFESSLEEESSLEKLPAAPTTMTPGTTPKSGELHPQETESEYNDATSSMKSAEEHTADTILMVIQAPKVLDASGATVPASLSVQGNTITMTVTPSGGTAWPATAEFTIGAPSDRASAAKATGAKYGFSDPHAATFGHEVEKKFVSNFDARLKSAPLEVKRARLFLNWNASPHSKELTNWLKAVKAAGLTPLITLRECEPTPEEKTCPAKKGPTLGEYYIHAKVLIKALLNGTSEMPSVRLWGSWNEPDHVGNAFHKDPQGPITAAYLWGETQRAAESAGCNHHCTVVAGEFAAYLGHHHYVSEYERTIIRAERNHRFPVRVKPHDWGMHDYNDLEQVKAVKEGDKEVLGKYVNKEVQKFAEKTKELYSSAHIWLTEQGVLLQNEKETPLYNDALLQKLAAQDFLRLGRPSEHTEWVYYYLYSGPNAATVAAKPHAFDSALLPGEGVTEEAGHPAENPRQAYCVLALNDKEGCPATTGTEAAVTSTVSSSAGTVTLDVNPGGSPTDYYIEYGKTTAYGHSTSSTAVTNEYGEQSETVALSGLEPCTTYHYQAEAENEANDGIPGIGGDRVFTTGGCKEKEKEEEEEKEGKEKEEKGEKEYGRWAARVAMTGDWSSELEGSGHVFTFSGPLHVGQKVKSGENFLEITEITAWEIYGPGSETPVYGLNVTPPEFYGGIYPEILDPIMGGSGGATLGMGVEGERDGAFYAFYVIPE